MSTDPDTLNKALAQSWGLSAQLGDDALLEELAHRVMWMLKHDYERLLNALYLLDIPEHQFHSAARLRRPEDTARALAEIVLARERQKFESRRSYRRAQSMDVNADDT